VAVTVADSGAVTVPKVATNEAEERPKGTLTDGGTVRAVRLLMSEIVTRVEAGWLRLTVQVAKLPATNDVGLQLKLDRNGNPVTITDPPVAVIGSDLPPTVADTALVMSTGTAPAGLADSVNVITATTPF
jgi:hypothetical protein